MGYYRFQTSLQNGKEDLYFKAPGAGSKYRLGNEQDTWIELGLYQDITFDNDITVHNQVRTVYWGMNEESVDYLQFDEAYSEISGIFDNSVSFWIGRRYYKRYDSHIADYWFLNMSGDGFGVNNLDLGEFTISYSFIFDQLDPESIDDEEDLLYHSHDVRLAKTTDRGEATLFLNYIAGESKTFGNGQHVDSVDGFAIGLLYKDTELTNDLFGMRGENISGIFYGEGAARGAGAYSPYKQDGTIDEMLISGKTPENSMTFRMINYNAFENDTYGIMSSMVFEHKDDQDFINIKQDWFSAGVRPYWFMHKHLRGVLEVGYDHVNNKTDSESHNLLKATVALEMAMDKGVWRRPALRLYFTQANWSESSKGEVGSGYYADKTSGYNFGIQIEEWW